MSKIAKFDCDTYLAREDLPKLQYLQTLSLYVGEHKLAKFHDFEELYLHLYFSTNHFQT